MDDELFDFVISIFYEIFNLFLMVIEIFKRNELKEELMIVINLF